MQGALLAGDVRPDMSGAAASLVHTHGALREPKAPAIGAKEAPVRVGIDGLDVHIVPGTTFTVTGILNKPAPMAPAGPLPPVAAAAVSKAASIAPAAGARGSLLGAVVGFMRGIYAKVVGLFVKTAPAAKEPAPALAAQPSAEQAAVLPVDGEIALVQPAYNPTGLAQALKARGAMFVNLGLPSQLRAQAAGLGQRFPLLQAQLGSVAQAVAGPNSTGRTAFGTALLGVFGAALYMGLPTFGAAGLTAAFAGLNTGLRYFEPTPVAVAVAVPQVPHAAADGEGLHVTQMEASFSNPIVMSLPLDPLKLVRAEVESFTVDATGRISPKGQAFIRGLPAVSLEKVVGKISKTTPTLFENLMPQLQTKVNELAVGNLFQGAYALPEQLV
jgi:hypothetical protein